MESLKWFYKVLRSVVFTAIIVVVALFALTYISLSLPPVQNRLKGVLQNKLENLFETRVEIDKLSIVPLNEVVITDASIYDPENQECIRIGRLGAGISIWRLIFGGKIEITHVELLDFKAKVSQKEKDGPLNIDFIIKALSPKDKNKPPTRFALKIHNVVLRGGELEFDRLWAPVKDNGTFDPNHIKINNLSADVTLPELKNDDIEIDLRRLSLNEQSGLQIKDIGGYAKISPDEIQVKNLSINLPETEINFKDFILPKNWFATSRTFDEPQPPVTIEIFDSKITPSDLSAFYRPLNLVNISFPFSMKLNGNMESIELTRFKLGGENGLALEINARIANLMQKGNLKLDIESLDATIDSQIEDIIAAIIPQKGKSDTLNAILNSIGTIYLRFKGGYDASRHSLESEADIQTANGRLSLSSSAIYTDGKVKGNAIIEIPTLNMYGDFPKVPITGLANARIEIDGVFNLPAPAQSNGTVDIFLGELNFRDRSISHIGGSIEKSGQNYDLAIEVDDDNLNGNIQASALLDGVDSRLRLTADLNDFDTYNSYIADKNTDGLEMSGQLALDIRGNDVDNLTGELEVHNFTVKKGSGEKIELKDLALNVSEQQSEKKIELKSEVLDVMLDGDYRLSLIPGMVKKTLGEVFPTIFAQNLNPAECGKADFDIQIKDAKQLIDFFKIPVFPLTALHIQGQIDSNGDRIDLTTEIPYIQQGKNKLITDTYLDIDIEGESSFASIRVGTVYPTKKGLLKIDMDLLGHHGEYDMSIGLNRGRDVIFNGEIPLSLLLQKDGKDEKLGVAVKWLPGELHVNDIVWKIEESEILYNQEGLTVKDFCIRHDRQFVFISGNNSYDGEGTINVTLSDIDVESIFETLNIPNVTFGGYATGGAVARNIFGKTPDIHTESLFIKDLSYNGAVVGDGDVSGRLDLPEKMVAIGAVVREGEKTVANVDGGVWFGRDSLSFNFDAHSVNIGFMQPFMAAFSSEVKGKASGQALLYGTFSDIDMKGVIAAENAGIRIDYTNTVYEGSDTVYMTPGRILLPNFQVKDKFGNTATVNGELTHRQFHDPEFKFIISDMDKLMVYDTNAAINPLWYGNIFVSGAGEVNGKPGSVNILADVETEEGSDFTFVLSDRQEAVKSKFLSFTDHRKEERLKALPKDTIPDFLKKFQANKTKVDETSSIYSMDFRVSVTPEIKFNLIMDPVGGDKITAWGEGAMNLMYSSLTDDLRIYGKYILEKGNYNFTLQDIILKDFTIKPGSSIAFTGDPYTGILDITAAYRVNTSLTELDQSFANDRDLNRTSVPVEALLKVTGPLTSPHIGFDIDLPTVTEETAQKVRSIISTEDMMSRQVLFLVALNKFYPPEYMSTATSGGEWASIASSTISSQIQNAIGQITDKFTVAPSIRSDKGDFSDIEVDLALSSQLFNNRLLINGNLGYRDPSNSSTTFIGDFDIEYLLTKKGNWRLKAYNHFNDQNYYLKSALTTQGLGIVWRKEFGKPAVDIIIPTKEEQTEEQKEKQE